jgi:hypothetical protein
VRVGRPVVALVGATILLAPILAVLAAPTPAAAARVSQGGVDKVLIIAAPHLTWDEVEDARPPNLMKLFGRSSIASLSVRTATSRTTLGAGYLSLGAGNRSATDITVDGLVVGRDEPLDAGAPAVIFRRNTVVTPTAPILALGLPQIQQQNDAEHFGTVPGALATALRPTHRDVGVVGNADQADGEPMFRQAGLFAIDADGQVRQGEVGVSLDEPDPQSPFGRRLSLPAVADAVGHTVGRSSVTLVEMSDLARAEAARALSTTAQGDRLYREALAHDDAIVGEILRRVDRPGARVRVMVVGPAAPIAREQLTVFSVAGPEDVRGGLATSSTTRRDGYVTLTDVAPTILDQWHVKVPDSMNDTVISTVSSDESLNGRIDSLIDASNRSLTRDGAFTSITVIFIVVLVVDLFLAVLYLARVKSLATTVEVLSLVVLWVPPLSFLEGLLPIGQMSEAAFGVVLFGGAVVAAGATWWFSRRGQLPSPWYPLLVTWAVLAVDVVFGAHLQINTAFGYSPIVAGRFAGFGNQAYSMFAITTLLLITASWEMFTDDEHRPSWFMPAMIVFLAVTVIVDGYPAFGSDVGGVLALVPAGAICLMLISGARLRFRRIAAIVLGTAAAISVFALVDLSRPPEDRTHLGRFVAKVFGGEGAQVIERKIDANLSVLNTVWSWIIPVALAYFAYLTWRPNKTFEELIRRHKGVRVFGISALVLGVLSMLLNDSGVSMPAMMLAISLAYITYLTVDMESPA